MTLEDFIAKWGWHVGRDCVRDLTDIVHYERQHARVQEREKCLDEACKALGKCARDKDKPEIHCLQHPDCSMVGAAIRLMPDEGSHADAKKFLEKYGEKFLAEEIAEFKELARETREFRRRLHARHLALVEAERALADRMADALCRYAFGCDDCRGGHVDDCKCYVAHDALAMWYAARKRIWKDGGK